MHPPRRWYRAPHEGHARRLGDVIAVLQAQQSTDDVDSSIEEELGVMELDCIDEGGGGKVAVNA